MSNKYEDLIKNARVNAECGEHMSPEEVTTLLNVVETTFAALAAENAGLKAAFDKPQAYLSWHTIPPTWEDPLPCGEYLDVHDDAGHKNSDGTDCWPVYAKPEINTPATDAFLAEVRAQGVDSAINTVIAMMNHQHPVTSKAIDIMRVHAYQIRKGVQS